MTNRNSIYSIFAISIILTIVLFIPIVHSAKVYPSLNSSYIPDFVEPKETKIKITINDNFNVTIDIHQVYFLNESNRIFITSIPSKFLPSPQTVFVERNSILLNYYGRLDTTNITDLNSWYWVNDGSDENPQYFIVIPSKTDQPLTSTRIDVIMPFSALDPLIDPKKVDLNNIYMTAEIGLFENYNSIEITQIPKYYNLMEDSYPFSIQNNKGFYEISESNSSNDVIPILIHLQRDNWRILRDGVINVINNPIIQIFVFSLTILSFVNITVIDVFGKIKKVLNNLKRKILRNKK